MRRSIIISSLFVIFAFAVYGVYYQFFSYETFSGSEDSQIANNKYGIYVNKGIADQTEYNSKVYRHAIGKTTNGDMIYALKTESSHKHLILIQNTEMPAWLLYSKK